MVLQLSLYGLKDFSQIWVERMKKKFSNSGIREMKSAPSTFVGAGTVAVCYVHDLLVFAETNDNIGRLKQSLKNELVMEDIGQPSSFLGIEVKWLSDTVLLRQRGLTLKLLEENNLGASKPMRTLMISKIDQGVNDQKKDVLDESEARKYRSIVGSISCIATKTRPDLSMAASSFGACFEQSSRARLVVSKRALRYLKGTSEYWMMLKPGMVNQLSAFIDSNWGCALDKNGKSRFGTIIRYGDATV